MATWSHFVSIVLSPPAFIAIAVLAGVYFQYAKNDTYRRPPGPAPIPFLGNIHQLPMEYQHRTLAEWGKQFGDVVFAEFFRTPVIVLNSREAAVDLMEKRSVKYSDRPPLIVLRELMGWDNVVNNLPYGERFRKHRKWLQDAFASKDALMGYRPIQRRETYTLLSGLCDSPDRFLDHITRWAAAMVLDIAYGHRVTSLGDELVETAEHANMGTVLAGSPGSVLVDFFPFLKHIPLWMPGSAFKREALRVGTLVRRTLDMPYDMVKRTLMAGTATPSFMATLLEEALAEGKLTPEHEEDIKGAAGIIYAAGSETTVTTLKTFLLAMLLHPEVYQRAREEIDSVVGQDRLPDFEDREQLPYLECVVKEVFRWNAPVPLGVPHRLNSNDVYRGYDLPGGAMVIPNLWWMTQDPKVYSESEKFNPDRFLQMAADKSECLDPRSIVFGFGRRVCPGQLFADASLWLVIANIIAAVNISFGKDASGRDIIPDVAFTSGVVSQPKNLKCDFAPRTEKTKSLIDHMHAVNVVAS